MRIKRLELIITIAGEQNRDLPLQYKHGNGAGSCGIHGTSPSSAKAVDVIGSGKMDVPRSDGTNEDGEDGRDGDGVVVEKCMEEEEQRERPKSLVFSSSVRTAGRFQIREKVGLTLATLLVI